jgi:hypothetical protein
VTLLTIDNYCMYYTFTKEKIQAPKPGETLTRKIQQLKYKTITPEGKSNIEFMKSDDIHELQTNGYYLSEIIVDEKCELEKNENKYKSKNFKFGKIYNTRNVSDLLYIIHHINKNINSVHLTNHASKIGDVELLQQWKESDIDKIYTDEAIIAACSSNRTNVLDWWKNSGLELKYTSDAINYASKYEHINILEWWNQSGLELKYTSEAVNWACCENKLESLKWWKESNLTIKYTEYAAVWAIKNGFVDVLDWLKTVNYPFNKKLFDVWVCFTGNQEIQDWWIKLKSK